ncbi:hypothetical protein PSEUDO8Z_60744 [Pseudomonas sp. 8Z]|nr:hypothetical protein PSEUDO8Z_60744 [Pseudomonas sp. 8Z]
MRKPLWQKGLGAISGEKERYLRHL